MREYLYANQRALANAVWSRPESSVGVDVALFEACVAESDRSPIDADIREAVRLNIRSTPAFLVGRPDGDERVQILARINGAQPYEVFEDTLKGLLNLN